MTDRLSDTDLAAMKRIHHPTTTQGLGPARCWACHTLWPCDTHALVAEVEALRADNERVRVESEKRLDALIDVRAKRDRAVTDRDRLLALLDPDNDETVAIVARVLGGYSEQQWAQWRATPSKAHYFDDATDVLAALRDAANGEG